MNFSNRHQSLFKTSYRTLASTLAFGCYALQAAESFFLKESNIESMRRVLVRHIRKNGAGIIHLRTFPSKAITAKPIKTRMGKGKGSFLYKVSPIRPGQILLEIRGNFSQEQAIQALKQASQKLPVLSCIVTRKTATQKAVKVYYSPTLSGGPIQKGAMPHKGVCSAASTRGKVAVKKTKLLTVFFSTS